MINVSLSFPLPSPWENQSFETDEIGPINFLVGPNGSGKSRFAGVLAGVLNGRGKTRLLGTERLRGMEQSRVLERYITGDTFEQGFAKNSFDSLKQAGNEGSGIDTIMLLDERMDLRIQVEATLSHLFGREIILEWDSGYLVGKVRRTGGSNSYRLDREECHGIKELLVLLTHLYNDEYSHLIIDEPELNLHPQYQAFFMQEVRKLAGDPSISGKNKIIFLITHSPFILDFRSEDDLKSVISFSLDYSAPKQTASLNLDAVQTSSTLIGRLSSHHKQLFFSDNPIFVEGILDAQLVDAMMEARGVSVAGAGSCIIDAGGAEEVNHFLQLCRGLGKKAYFLYDLDSLFHGNLRACISEDQSIKSFLAFAGLGNDFVTYCGGLDRKLTCFIDRLLNETLPKQLGPLGEFLRCLGERKTWDKGQWAKARTATMTAISLYGEAAESLSKEDVADIRGRMTKIVGALKKKNIHLLPGGTLERYLPCYQGDKYKLNETAKRQAVTAEIRKLSEPLTETDLPSRYGELYDAVRNLPSKADVDVDPILRNYLSDYIHEIQKAILNNPGWNQDQIQDRLNILQPALSKVFSIQTLKSSQDGKFSAGIGINEMLGQEKRFAEITQNTNAGMGDFEIKAWPDGQ